MSRLLVWLVLTTTAILAGLLLYDWLIGPEPGHLFEWLLAGVVASIAWRIGRMRLKLRRIARQKRELR